MATWCPVCRGELPHFAISAPRFPKSDVALFGYPIDPNDSARRMCPTMADRHDPHTTIVADATTDQREQLKQTLIKHLGDAALPSTAVIDKHGQSSTSAKASPSLSELRRLLREIQ